VAVARDAIEVAESALRLHARASGAQVLVVDDLPTSLPPVLANRQQLQHVIINLLINARDAMPAGGRIRIAGTEDASGVVLTIEDEGVGIPPENLDHIFDAFFTTKGAMGTGMGLAMSRNVIQGLGGAIRASNRPDRGARFEISLPRYESVTAEPAEVSAEPAEVSEPAEDAQDPEDRGDRRPARPARHGPETSG
jgi:signal transduction histidine kinase